jgi:membrane dipeptidase
MEAQGELHQITDLAQLHVHLALWQGAEDRSRLPIGYILSLEGADSLLSLEHLDLAYAYGLRAVGPAHYGPGRYAHGTDASAPLNAQGRALLRAMEQKNMILDATHLCDLAFWDAMESYQGPVWASHNLVRALVPHNRQFSDDMLRELIRRKAVIGMAFDAWMMVPNWIRGQTTPQAVGLRIEQIVAHIDHICQLAGSSAYVGIGSDLDGGFGTEQAPMDLGSIADLQKIPALLQARGYTDADIEGIMWRNWVTFLERAWG